jgi:porphobilinogen synthase
METKYISNRRRIRANTHIRELVANVYVDHRDFIQPLFVDESVAVRTPMTSLNGIAADTIESLLEQIASDLEQGISKFLLFPVPLSKSNQDFDFSFVLHALKSIKEKFGSQVWIAADTCLCAYTLHGHCGLLNETQTAVLNHESVTVLAQYALALAKAGADCIAPSDMMDGRIAAIRKVLDDNGFDHIAILSYSAKFSSQFYGPFRDACKSSPGNNPLLKDRKTYQFSAFNANDGLLSTIRDIEEGADMVMVKPALPYLDIIQTIKQETKFPLVAYHVSGEYQALELLAEKQLVDRSQAHLEIWTSLKRAGADSIISYAARHAKEWIATLKF